MNKPKKILETTVTQGYPERLFELLVVFIISTSILGLSAALMGHFKSELIVVLSLLVTSVYNHMLRLGGVALDKSKTNFNWFYILTIILIGLFFRITPFHYIFGGQDQGVYVNIASSIERTGKITAIDPVIDSMTETYMDQYVKENYESSYLPGVYKTINASGKIGAEFQFYHLFPVWMAIFEGTFGSEGSVYALTFLSIVSLLFCYQFVRVVSGNDFAAFVAALLLALNPLHSFFSKWPVTEVPTLAFSLAGFSYLAIYWFSTPHRLCNSRFLFLSALSFGGLFFTRISGFMYVPILLAIFASILLSEENKEKANSIALWAILVFGLYGISVWYGLTWSASYSNDIYRISFSKIFGEEWRTGVLALVLLLILALSLIIYSTKTGKFEKNLASILNWLYGKLGLAFAVVAVAGIAKIYQFAFTDRYSSDPWVAQLWGLANKGWASVAASSLVVTTTSASPLIFLIFLYFMLLQWKDNSIRLTQFFLLSIFAYIALLQFFVPYQPYYDRYLLSELVPYMIIFVVWGWSQMKDGRGKKIVSSLLLIVAVYSGILASLHTGKEEQRGAYDGLSRIASAVGENDLILLHGKDLWGQIKTPLIYKFGKNVASISDESLLDSNYLSFLNDSYDDVYILSSSQVELEKLQYLGIRRVTFDFFNRASLPPSSVITKRYKLFLYKFDATETASLMMYRDDLFSLPGSTGATYDRKKISNGNPGFLVFGPYASLPKAKYHFVVRGEAKKAPTAWVDIVSGKGTVQHGKFFLNEHGRKNGMLAEGVVVLDMPVSDIEVRVFVGEEDEVMLAGYELVPVADKDEGTAQPIQSKK